MPLLKNARHEHFALQYFGGQSSATQAAIKAGYAPGSAHVTSSRLLRNAKVLSRIRELQQLAVNDEVATVLQRKIVLTKIARTSIGQFLTTDGSINIQENGAGPGLAEYSKRTLRDGTIVEMIRLRDPVAAIGELNRMDGLYSNPVRSEPLQPIYRINVINPEEAIRGSRC